MRQRLGRVGMTAVQEAAFDGPDGHGEGSAAGRIRSRRRRAGWPVVAGLGAVAVVATGVLGVTLLDGPQAVDASAVALRGPLPTPEGASLRTSAPSKMAERAGEPAATPGAITVAAATPTDLPVVETGRGAEEANAAPVVTAAPALAPVAETPTPPALAPTVVAAPRIEAGSAPVAEVPESAPSAQAYPKTVVAAPSGGPRTAVSPAVPPQDAALARPRSPAPAAASSPDVAALVKRARDLIGHGDIAAARLLLERAAAGGQDPHASYALAETFDPTVLARWGVRGVRPDAERARALYQQAADQGSAQARERVAAMAP